MRFPCTSCRTWSSRPRRRTLGDRVVRVGEQGEVEVVLVGELLDRLDLVGRDPEHPRAGLVVVGAVVADAAGLGRAAGRVGAGIEVEDDGSPQQIVSLTCSPSWSARVKSGAFSALRARRTRSVRAAGLLAVVVLVEHAVALFEGGLGARPLRPGGSGSRISRGSWSRRPSSTGTSSETHPVGLLVCLHVEGLLVEGGGVVDDQSTSVWGLK